MPTIKIFKFFEYIHRMTYIIRWSLMDCRKQEDLKQHSFDVAMISHALVVIHNDVLNLPRKLDAAKAALLAMYHDASEIFTGDVPTPIKYFGGGAMKGILDKIEGLAVDKLVGSLPDKMQPAYRDALDITAEYKPYIKAADRLAALRKCREELAAGNQEFAPAAARLEEALKSSGMPEIDYFMANFMTDKPMSLDALIEGNGAWLIEEEEAHDRI
jgi:5'-deoxynucleotidase